VEKGDTVKRKICQNVSEKKRVVSVGGPLVNRGVAKPGSWVRKRKAIGITEDNESTLQMKVKKKIKKVQRKKLFEKKG